MDIELVTLVVSTYLTMYMWHTNYMYFFNPNQNHIDVEQAHE